MEIGRKRMNGKGVILKCSRDHSLRVVLAGNLRVPFPRAPSCCFGHQRAPVFQKYYGKVTNVSNVFHCKRTPVKLISIHVYIKTVPRAGDSILISTLSLSQYGKKRSTSALFLYLQKWRVCLVSCYNL